MKLEKLAINPTNEFHILRHFESVDNSYKETLLGMQYWYYGYEQKKFISSYITKEEILYATKTIGTKFYNNITEINNPKKLLDLIKEKYIELNSKKEIYWRMENERMVADFSINYRQPIGEMNCLSINKIGNKDKGSIKSVFRSKCAGENNVNVNTISGIKLSTTNVIYVEIVEVKQLPFFVITAFPDCSANNNSPDDAIVFVV